MELTCSNLGKSVREAYSLASYRWPIVEGAVYEDETRVEHVVFQGIQLDTGMAVGSFRL